jgi:hypothetical protein
MLDADPGSGYLSPFDMGMMTEKRSDPSFAGDAFV